MRLAIFGCAMCITITGTRYRYVFCRVLHLVPRTRTRLNPRENPRVYPGHRDYHYWAVPLTRLLDEFSWARRSADTIYHKFSWADMYEILYCWGLSRRGCASQSQQVTVASAHSTTYACRTRTLEIILSLSAVD